MLAFVAGVLLVLGAFAGWGAAAAIPYRQAPTIAARDDVVRSHQQCPRRDPGILRVGVKYDVPQFGYFDKRRRTWEGFDLDIGRAVAKRVGKDMVPVPTETKNRISLLHGDCVDVVLSTFTIAEDRPVAFSKPYFVAGARFLTRKGESASVESLSMRDTICTTAGSTSARLLEQRASLVLRDTFSQCYGLLRGGAVDAVAGDDVILLGFLVLDPDHLQLSGKTFSTERYGAGIALENPERSALLAAVDAVVDDLVRSRIWHEICEKWVGSLTGGCASHLPSSEPRELSGPSRR